MQFLNRPIFTGDKREILNLPFEIPIFEILLIAFGVLLLVRAFKKPETKIECCL